MSTPTREPPDNLSEGLVASLLYVLNQNRGLWFSYDAAARVLSCDRDLAAYTMGLLKGRFNTLIDIRMNQETHEYEIRSRPLD